MKQKKIVFAIFGIVLLVATLYFVSAEITPSLNLNGQNRFTITDYQKIAENYYVKTNTASDIQTKVNICNGANCTVIIPCGFYNLTSEISLHGNITIKGNGECSIINVGNSSATFKGYNDTGNILIQDLYINKNNFSTQMFNFLNTNSPVFLTFRNIHIKNSPVRVFQFNSSVTVMIDNVFLDNTFSAIGIYPYNNHTSTEAEAVHMTVQNSRFVNENYDSASPTEYGEGIECNSHGTGTCNILNNYISGYREEVIDCNSEYCNIIGNELVGVYNETRDSNIISTGLSNDVASGSNTIKQKVVISNNRFRNIATTGKAIYPHGSISSIEIINNKFESEQGATEAINFGSGASRNIVINGNYFLNFNTSVTAGGSALNSTLTFIGNTIDNKISGYGYKGLHINLATTKALVASNTISNMTEGIRVNNLATQTVLLNNQFFNVINNVVGDTTENDNIDWNLLNGFPVACPAGSFISELGDSVICTSEGTSILDVSNQYLTAAYNFNNNSVNGINILDSSENNFNLNNTLAVFENNGFNNGGSYRFDGTGNMTIKGSISIIQNSYTINAWVKAYSSDLEVSQDGYFVDLRNGTSATSKPYSTIGIRSGQFKTRLVTNTSNCDISSTSTGADKNDSSWHMVTGIFNGSNQFLYVDGILADSDSYSVACSALASSNTLNLIAIGNGQSVNGEVNASIDDVRIYSRALSSTEVLSLYNSKSEVQNSVFSKKSNIIPSLNLIYSIGSSTLRWLKLWVQDIDASGNINISGNTTFSANGGYVIYPVNTTAKICAAGTQGAVYYDGSTKKHYGCNSTTWNALY